MTYPVGEITENGVTVPIFVDDFGYWSAEHSGRTFRDDTRSKLRDRIKKETRRTVRKVDVPFVRVAKGQDGIKFWRGTATGIHAGNGNVLYTRTNHGTEIKEQFTGSGSNTATLGNVPDDVLKRYHQLVIAYGKAERELYRFEQEHKINLKDVVTAALDKD